MERFDTERLNSIVNTLGGMALVGKTDSKLFDELFGIMIDLDDYLDKVEADQ